MIVPCCYRCTAFNQTASLPLLQSHLRTRSNSHIGHHASQTQLSTTRQADHTIPLRTRPSPLMHTATSNDRPPHNQLEPCLTTKHACMRAPPELPRRTRTAPRTIELSHQASMHTVLLHAACSRVQLGQSKGCPWGWRHRLWRSSLTRGWRCGQ